MKVVMLIKIMIRNKKLTINKVIIKFKEIKVQIFKNQMIFNKIAIKQIKMKLIIQMNLIMNTL